MLSLRVITVIVAAFVFALPAYCTSSPDEIEQKAELRLFFRVNSADIDTAYLDNANEIATIENLADRLSSSSNTRITQISLIGCASPEGNTQLNTQLSRKRMDTMERHLKQHLGFSDSIAISRDESYIPWDYLYSMVEQDNNFPDKKEVLEILSMDAVQIKYGSRTIDRRVPLLRRLDNGTVWDKMMRDIFPLMRNALAVVVTITDVPQPTGLQSEPLISEPEQEPVRELTAEPNEQKPASAPAETLRHWYIKTNIIAWGMLISNIAGELDLGSHWSITLPIYYSAVNYFKRTLKFRTLAIQPEARYWFSHGNGCDGFFVGAHMGLAWFNYAGDGDYRYQDHKGHSPAPGGGISVGYRLPIRKEKPWKMEFSVGAGIYSLYYDKFENRPDGKLISTHRRTFYGIDNAAVTICYTFNLNNRSNGNK